MKMITEHLCIDSDRRKSKYSVKYMSHCHCRGSGSIVSIATGYGLDGPEIESRWGRDFP